MRRFALIGAAGYIAPRHMEAILVTGNELVAAFDPCDSVGVIDSYFPQASFFTEIERFDRYLEKLKRKGQRVDYVVVCSPNYLHDAHIRFGLRYGADVICEKPVVLNPWNIDALQGVVQEYGKQVYSILQLRLHPQIVTLKQKVEQSHKNEKYEVVLTYQTSRGKWYYASWKSIEEKSGGVATNIGVHFFDMLTWVFGDVKKNIVHQHTHDRASGFIELEKARVKWFLSINEETIDRELRDQGKRKYRSMKVDGKEINFTDGFEQLHIASYRKILAGEGFTMEETRSSIDLIHQIRNREVSRDTKNAHPYVHKPLSLHPFKNKNNKT